MFALACETVSRRVSRLPFLRSGVMVTGELLGVALECLNAEFKKTLILRTLLNAPEKPVDGLDRCIEKRLNIPGKTVVPVVVDVLCSAGIAETTEIMDPCTRKARRGIRLLPPWTWHTATVMTPAVRFQGSGKNDTASALSWMSICPICRTGILNRIVGKQLFGIPHTDFYVECTHCGAKFIPVGPQFRLVSIATVRDPLWKKYLDQTFPAETWESLARGTAPGGKSLPGPTEKTPGKNSAGKSKDLPSGGFTQTKDGSLIVPFKEKTLYFKPVKLIFSGGVREDLFSRAQTPLQELLKNPEFSHLIPLVNTKYSRYLPLRTGLFLGQLKERHDPVYREFLNIYGDEKYGTFRMEESGEGSKNGVLIVVSRKTIYHIVNCRDTFRIIINTTFGRISSDDCLLNGDSTRCRINALLCNNKNDAGIYNHPVEKEDERTDITEVLKRSFPSGT
ncbi:MAG: hypothetical protein LUQ54_04985 [Methanoregula sp.]|nr:hypothetical protein [Methanoregula sp.]